MSVGRNLHPSGASVEATEAAPMTDPVGRNLRSGSRLRQRSSGPEDPLGRSPFEESGGAALQFLAVPKNVQRFPSVRPKATLPPASRQICRLHCFRGPVTDFATRSKAEPYTYAPTMDTLFSNPREWGLRLSWTIAIVVVAIVLRFVVVRLV